jgi:hypothetical protein
MQCVIREGEDFVFATHEDGQDVAGAYPAQDVTAPDDGAAYRIPAGVVVPVPRDFAFAVDELGRRKDPRRFAAEGATPLEP